MFTLASPSLDAEARPGAKIERRLVRHFEGHTVDGQPYG